MKMFACYVRVSTVGQNEESQKSEIEKWLFGHGVLSTDVRWFVDRKSGDNLDRPEFEKLQKAVFTGEIHTVLTYKLDRLSRKMADGISTLSSWLDSGVRFVSVSQSFDFSGTVGKMVAAVLLGVAEMEQETRKERQKAGIEVAKEQGKYKGRKKGTTKAKPSRALQLRDQGFTIKEIAAALSVSRGTVFSYLKKAKNDAE